MQKSLGIGDEWPLFCVTLMLGYEYTSLTGDRIFSI